jgi:hypothetical protein
MTQSWYLENADKIAQESKYTFYKPSQRVIKKLEPGNICKLIFEFESEIPEHPSAERMWVIIDSIDNDKFVGHLDNEPFYTEDLKVGDRIEFESKHIIDIDVDDSELNLAEKYLDRCFATKGIIYEKNKIGYFYREEPMKEDKDGFKDSGWRFLEGDESQEFLDDSENSQFVSLGLILNIDDSFIDLLEKPIGSAFIRDSETGQFIHDH